MSATTSADPQATRLPDSWQPELREFREVLHAALTQRSPLDRVRAAMSSDKPLDRDLWSSLCGEFELPAMLVPAEDGGLGYSLVELGVALEALGRSLAVSPLFATAVLATSTLRLSRQPEAHGYLRAIAAGGCATATFAGFGIGSGSVTARQPDGGEWMLTGARDLVLDAGAADLVLVEAACPDGTGIFAVDLNSPDVERSVVTGWDLTRKWASVRFDRAAATRLVGPNETASVVSRVLTVARAALCVEQVGVASGVLDMARHHALTREQFGGPIGRLQAVKHQLADMFLAVESSRALAYHVLDLVAAGHPQAATLAAAAKARSSQMLSHVANQNIQLHGAIGVTWEHPAHLYLKRAVSTWPLFGDPEALNEQVIDAVRPDRRDGHDVASGGAR